MEYKLAELTPEQAAAVREKLAAGKEGEGRSPVSAATERLRVKVIEARRSGNTQGAKEMQDELDTVGREMVVARREAQRNGTLGAMQGLHLKKLVALGKKWGLKMDDLEGAEPEEDLREAA